jgi:hypothetical protein
LSIADGSAFKTNPSNVGCGLDRSNSKEFSFEFENLELKISKKSVEVFRCCIF